MGLTQLAQDQIVGCSSCQIDTQLPNIEQPGWIKPRNYGLTRPRCALKEGRHSQVGGQAAYMFCRSSTVGGPRQTTIGQPDTKMCGLVHL